MKKVLNHEDKENRNAVNLPRGGHPSQESQPRAFKPAIKYALPHAGSDTKSSTPRKSNADT